MPMNPTSVNSSYTYRTLPPSLGALRPLKSGSYPLLSLRRYFLRRGDLSQLLAQPKAVVRTNMKRGQGISPTNLSGRKSKRRSSRGSRLAAAAEGISSEILSPSLQTKSSETSTAVPTNKHPEREALPGQISTRVSHALQVSRDTLKKESRLLVHSPQSTRGNRSCAVSSVPSTVARRTRPPTTKTSTRRSTSKRPQEKEPIGHDGQSDVIGHEVKNLATLLYPAVEPEEELGLASGLEQQVDGERVDQKAQHGSGENSPQKCPLEIMFHGLEQVLLLFRRRKQTPLLKKITAGVEAMCGRSFTKHHLAQILFVQPDAYKVSSKTDAKPTRGGYRLRDILIEFGVSDGAGEVNPKSGGNGSSSLRSPGGSAIESVSSRRRKAFQQLLRIATSRYCKCTADIDNGMDTGECSCLPEALLPDTSPLPVSGKPCLGTGGNGTASPSNVRGLLGSAGVPRGGVESDGWDAPKNVDALRERLRQKDLISALKRNKTGEEKEADRRRKGNLPAVADAVRSFFAHSRRNTCGLTALVEALSSSGRHALSAKEAKERLRMLADVVPEWCTIIAPPNARKGAGSRGGIVDEGMVGQPIKAQEVVRVNTRIHYGEVRQMIVFMAGRGDNT